MSTRKFYVSCFHDDGKRFVLLAGPFDTHEEALGLVDRARIRAQEMDPRTVWYSYGTCRTPEGYDAPGILNADLGLSICA